MTEKKQSKAPSGSRPVIRGPFDRVRTYTEVDGDSRTKTYFTDEANINSIMARYEDTGQLPPGALGHPEFQHAHDISFHEAMNLVTDAQAKFMELPSDVRAMFRNDPNELLEFLSDDENAVEAFELGFLETDPREAHEIAPEGDTEHSKEMLPDSTTESEA